MKLSSKEVYPISYQFEQFLVGCNILRVQEDGSVEWLKNEAPGPKFLTLLSTAKTMLMTLAEYEHGYADITSLFDEISLRITVPGTDRKFYGWSPLEEGTTPEQEEWNTIMERAMLRNLVAIYSDLLEMMIAQSYSK